MRPSISVLTSGSRRRRLASDDGTTLVELVVGISLMSIFMAMYTCAVVAMNNSENKAQAVNITSGQLNQAYLNLDKTVRYANAISTPGVGTSGDWYAELQTSNTGVQKCTQVRVDIASQQLQQRTWTPSAAPSDLSAWAPTASGISNGNAAPDPTKQPFYLNPPPPATTYQQLTINLTSPSGSGSTLTTSTTSFTFTALNSTRTAPTTAFCQQARP